MKISENPEIATGAMDLCLTFKRGQKTCENIEHIIVFSQQNLPGFSIFSRLTSNKSFGGRVQPTRDVLMSRMRSMLTFLLVPKMQ